MLVCGSREPTERPKNETVDRAEHHGVGGDRHRQRHDRGDREARQLLELVDGEPCVTRDGLDACLSFGGGARHSGSRQIVGAQLEMRAHLLGQVLLPTRVRTSMNLTMLNTTIARRCVPRPSWSTAAKGTISSSPHLPCVETPAARSRYSTGRRGRASSTSSAGAFVR
jgi:hypothetical protein